MERKTKTVTFAEGKELTFETGKIAKQSNGSVLVRCGETVIFASACAAPTASEDIDFLPLRVDYQEKFSSAGKSLGGFIKREGRPSEKEILTSRLIDRPIRPMFEDGYYSETQILAYVWSYDGETQPEPLAMCAVSAALSISDIPLIKPIACVRVGLLGERFVINPTGEEMKKSKLDLLIAGTEDAVLMIEGFCDFLTEEQVLEAIKEGHQSIQTICHAIAEWQKEVGKEKNRSALRSSSDDLVKIIDDQVKEPVKTAIRIAEKQARGDALSEIEKSVTEKLIPEGTEKADYTLLNIKGAFKKVTAKYMREMILKENIRPDKRGPKDIRPIDVEPGLLPRTHGSALFTRGETQAVAVCTLGGESMGQRYENLDEDRAIKRFYLQYFFPPYSVGEVGRFGPPSRREHGHGSLAERALKCSIPSLDVFPYTIRLESNITESNGSSSMASVCGGCLAMMDAGVPITRPVAGIAMGLILEGEQFAILSDILGLEDALGDMDFKITGDDKGITAFQMDIKVEGITVDIMRAALAQAREGRVHILGKMLEVLPKSKKEMSIYAPRIETVKINPSKIAAVIGPGGKQIRAIIEQTGVQIDINDDGVINIASSDPEGMAKAKEIIESLVGEVEVNKIYTGKVTSVVAFGVFVEILPGKEGLCHISELSDTRVTDIFEHIKAGDVIDVKVLDINERGQLKLSRKVLLNSSPRAKAPEAAG